MNDWTPGALPIDELDRLRRLLRLGVSEGQRHEFLDTITTLASAALGAPRSVVSLVEENRQLFIARHGLDAASTGRAESFCGHAILGQTPFVVDDSALDRRFAGNPLVVGAPHVRAYLGVPLFAGPAQSAIGTLCVLDDQPRAWTPEQQANLTRLAGLVENYLDGLAYRRAWHDSPLAFVVVDREGRCLRANPAFERFVGRSLTVLLERPLAACVHGADRNVLQTMIAQALDQRTSPTRREIRFLRLNGETVLGGTSLSPLMDLDDQVVCVIRDVSLERRMAARSGVVAQVRRELDEPLAVARGLVHTLSASSPEPTNRREFERLDDVLRELDGLIDARVGDIAARVRVESELHASEARLRSLVENVLGPMVVLDDHGRIVDANATALTELGWRYDQLVGASMRIVHPSFNDTTCRRWFELAEQRSADLTRSDCTATFVRHDDSEMAVELRLMVMDWNGPGRLVVIARDVTDATRREATLTEERDHLETQLRTGVLALSELQRMESVLKGSLEEKETLLKEIHHRVKNNLQMVSSLLTLQMDQMPDARSKELLGESVRRVRSMALIHQHLYGSVSLERIDLGAYARNLADTLRFALAPSARLRIDVDPVEVSVDHAAPICLILNELLTNAFKYGAATASLLAPPVADSIDDWDVLVELREEGRQLELVVRDRGPGLPANFSLRGGNSLGLQLVLTLARQLRGKVDARSDRGAVFSITCPL